MAAFIEGFMLSVVMAIASAALFGVGEICSEKLTAFAKMPYFTVGNVDIYSLRPWPTARPSFYVLVGVRILRPFSFKVENM